MSEKEIKFNTENDLNVAIIKDGKELLINEDCCTCINIMLRNDGQILTSFLGSHNPYIVAQLEKAQKYYFKGLKKALKNQTLDVDYGCGCGHEHCDCEEHECDCHEHDCHCGDECDCEHEHNKCECKEKTSKKSSKKEKCDCGCGEGCTCGDDCKCDEDHKCNPNCTCGENKNKKSKKSTKK